MDLRPQSSFGKLRAAPGSGPRRCLWLSNPWLVGRPVHPQYARGRLAEGYGTSYLGRSHISSCSSYQRDQALLQTALVALQRPSSPCLHSHACAKLGVSSRVAVRAAAGGFAAEPGDGVAAPISEEEGGAAARIAVPPSLAAASQEDTYSLEDTRALVETAMLSAVSGLAFLLSTLLKLDSSLGYFLPLPIVLAGCRSGAGASWNAMVSTAFLLLVLLGPLRAVTYVLVHGLTAAALGSMWRWQVPWSVSIPVGAALRMTGQLGYLLLTSVTMNENLFAVVLANVHGLLDRLSAAIGTSGAPSTLTVQCMLFALLLVNALCHVFLLHVIYHIILSAMGYKLGGLPGIIRKYLYAGLPQQPQAAAAAGSASAPSPKAGQ